MEIDRSDAGSVRGSRSTATGPSTTAWARMPGSRRSAKRRPGVGVSKALFLKGVEEVGTVRARALMGLSLTSVGVRPVAKGPQSGRAAASVMIGRVRARTTTLRSSRRESVGRRVGDATASSLRERPRVRREPLQGHGAARGRSLHLRPQLQLRQGLCGRPVPSELKVRSSGFPLDQSAGPWHEQLLRPAPLGRGSHCSKRIQELVSCCVRDLNDSVESEAGELGDDIVSPDVDCPVGKREERGIQRFGRRRLLDPRTIRLASHQKWIHEPDS